VLGVAAGTAAATSRRRWAGPLLLAGSAVSLSLPLFATALLLQLVFSAWLGWLPASGGGLGPAGLVLPVLTCLIPSAGYLARFVKVAVEEHAGDEHVRAALARGVRRRAVIVRHVLRVSLTPVIAVVSSDLARLLGGIVLVEVIFARPGIGRYAFDALVSRDLPALEGAVLVVSLWVLVCNTVADWAGELARRPAGAAV
jgi:peptide/nickel transport system permease protein